MAGNRKAGVPHRFTALARGALLAGNSWNGMVLSIHERAIYILRDDNLAVSIVANEESMTAMSVLVPLLFSAPPGENIVARVSSCTRDRLLIKDFAAIDLAACPTWSGRLPSFAPHSITIDTLQRVTKALEQFGSSRGLFGVLKQTQAAEGESPHVTAARQALQAGSFWKLVGLGPGLTPAGDDFLVGAQLAAAIFRPDRQSSFTLDSEQIRARFAGTTPAGRTLLWTVIQGHFPAPFVNFANALTQAKDIDLDAAVRGVCEYGESSGTDVLTGFCWMASRFIIPTRNG